MIGLMVTTRGAPRTQRREESELAARQRPAVWADGGRTNVTEEGELGWQQEEYFGITLLQDEFTRRFRRCCSATLYWTRQILPSLDSCCKAGVGV